MSPLASLLHLGGWEGWKRAARPGLRRGTVQGTGVRTPGAPSPRDGTPKVPWGPALSAFTLVGGPEEHGLFEALWAPQGVGKGVFP